MAKPAELCINCGHGKFTFTNGQCAVYMGKDQWCGCKCVFPKPKCELCGHDKGMTARGVCLALGCFCECIFLVFLEAAQASVQDEPHPESYCYRCDGPNISWYAPSLLWNQFVRAKSEPEIICPICFVRLAEQGGCDTTWSILPALTALSTQEAYCVQGEPLIKLRTAIELLLFGVRTVREGEPLEAEVPVRLRAGDILQARAALNETVEAAYAARATQEVPQRDEILALLARISKLPQVHGDCGNDNCRACSAVEEVATAASSLRKSLQEVPQAGVLEIACWHCGVVLAGPYKPRCEECPDECDTEGCKELGCSKA